MKGGYLRNIFETSSTINVTLSHTLTSQEFWEVGRNNSQKKKKEIKQLIIQEEMEGEGEGGRGEVVAAAAAATAAAVVVEVNGRSLALGKLVRYLQ